MSNSIWVIVPAAGQGRRFGDELPKQYQKLLNKTVLEQTLERFVHRDDVTGVVVAVSERDKWIGQLNLHEKVHVVEGGRERSDSVYAGLKFLEDHIGGEDLVAVHDAARPCVRQSSIDRLFFKARYAQYGLVLALPATDTIKKVNDHKVEMTLDRNQIYLAQTPQVFKFKLLRLAHKNLQANRVKVTDDASAVEALGYMPDIIEGTKANIKITTKDDLGIASFYLSRLQREGD